MAFMLRRPFAVASALRQAPKASSTTIRAFHNTPLKSAPQSFFTSRTTAPSLAQSHNVFHNTFRNAFRRNYMQQTTSTANPEFRQRLLYGAGIFGGTLLAINL